jgi:hypothetical protein
MAEGAGFPESRGYWRLLKAGTAAVRLPGFLTRTRERKALNAIENMLEASEPRLAAKYAIFARLAKDEKPSARNARDVGPRYGDGPPLSI